MAGGIFTTTSTGSSGDTSGDRILRSPREATNVFSLGGSRAPRQKNTFIVNFKKSGDSSATGGGTTSSTATGTSSSTWNKEMGFLVKSVDRPSVEPKVEELNQYNKKRVVHTGYKIGPTRLVLYDTADSMVMQMWNEYSRYYFGDFRHDQSPTDFALDTTSATFNGASTGFGFAPQSSTSSALSTTTDLQVPYFFDSISVYQVYGGYYVQFDLINPKIISFDPDEMDYSNSEIATFTMAVTAEAILYKNNFQPQSISNDAFLSEAFQGNFKGDVVEYAGSQTTGTGAGTMTPQTQPTFGSDAILLNMLNQSNTTVPLQSYTNTTGTGSLSAYGQYNFGALGSVAPTSQALASDLSLLATANPALASVLLGSAQAAAQSAGVQQLIQPYQPLTYLSQEQYDMARNAVQAVGQSVGNLDDSTAIGQQVTAAIMAAAIAASNNPRDQMYNRAVPTNDFVNSWQSTNGQGLALTQEAYGIMNAQRAPAAPIGYNSATPFSRANPPQYVDSVVNGGRPSLTMIDPNVPIPADLIDGPKPSWTGSDIALPVIETQAPTTLQTNSNSLYRTVSPGAAPRPLP